MRKSNATYADRDADPNTIPGRLRRLAFKVQQCTVGIGGSVDAEHEAAAELLAIAAEMEAGG